MKIELTLIEVVEGTYHSKVKRDVVIASGRIFAGDPPSVPGGSRKDCSEYE